MEKLPLLSIKLISSMVQRMILVFQIWLQVDETFVRIQYLNATPIFKESVSVNSPLFK